MARVLHISASPRGDRSKSLRVAQALLEEYQRRKPADEIRRLDLSTAKLPAFDGPVVQAKYNILHGQESNAAEREAWRAVEAVIAEFKSADKYVFSLPMWNFGVPYTLKHYFDVLVQPGYTFSFDPQKGYAGLVTGKPAIAVYARGGEYAAAEAARLDFQKPYLETILGFIGLSDVRTLVIEPTLAGGPGVADERAQQAIAKAAELARTF
jgi:FMN-dependent NADH-azoreductase